MLLNNLQCMVSLLQEKHMVPNVMNVKVEKECYRVMVELHLEDDWSLLGSNSGRPFCSNASLHH